MTGEAGAHGLLPGLPVGDVLPGNSEVVLAALVASMPASSGRRSPATAGNTAGGMTSWAIGRYPAGGGRLKARAARGRARRGGTMASRRVAVVGAADRRRVRRVGLAATRLAAATLAIVAGKLARYAALSRRATSSADRGRRGPTIRTGGGQSKRNGDRTMRRRGPGRPADVGRTRRCRSPSSGLAARPALPGRGRQRGDGGAHRRRARRGRAAARAERGPPPARGAENALRRRDARPVQIVAPVSRSRSTSRTCGALPEADRAAEARRRAGTSATPFDLARAAVRARLCASPRTSTGCFVTMHHIVTDGWSTGVLGHELGALRRVPRGPSLASPGSPSSTPTTRGEQRERTGDAPPRSRGGRTRSPTCRPRPAGRPALRAPIASHEGRCRTFEIDAGLRGG